MPCHSDRVRSNYDTPETPAEQPPQYRLARTSPFAEDIREVLTSIENDYSTPSVRAAMQRLRGVVGY